MQTDVLTTIHSDRKDARVMTEILGRYVEVLEEEGLASAKGNTALKSEGVGHPWSQDALKCDEYKVNFYPSYRTLIVIFRV